jgi:hypothetical protein
MSLRIIAFATLTTDTVDLIGLPCANPVWPQCNPCSRPRPSRDIRSLYWHRPCISCIFSTNDNHQRFTYTTSTPPNYWWWPSKENQARTRGLSYEVAGSASVESVRRPYPACPRRASCCWKCLVSSSQQVCNVKLMEYTGCGET